nr:hypothetical protein [Polynucleobacter aenigmaticus]
MALGGDLLHHFGNLLRPLSNTPEKLTQIQSMGISKWSQIQAAYELVKRSLEKILTQDSIFSSPGYVREFL